MEARNNSITPYNYVGSLDLTLYKMPLKVGIPLYLCRSQNTPMKLRVGTTTLYYIIENRFRLFQFLVITSLIIVCHLVLIIA